MVTSGHFLGNFSIRNIIHGVTSFTDNYKFKHICASEEHIWAVTKEGVLCKRIGISEDYPEGVSWIYGLPVSYPVVLVPFVEFFFIDIFPFRVIGCTLVNKRR